MMNEIELPDGDVLLHAGDATFKGDEFEINQFNQDLKKAKAKYRSVIFTPGNHDWGFQRMHTFSESLMTNATVLIDQGVWLGKDGVIIAKYTGQTHDELPEGSLLVYGSPWQPRFYNWAFNLDRGEPLARKWAMIPDHVDILITHGPPLGILDKVHGENVGCWDLRERIKSLTRLRLHVCGHIHYSYGVYREDKVTFANASVCNEGYDANNKPIVVDVFAGQSNAINVI